MITAIKYEGHTIIQLDQYRQLLSASQIKNRNVIELGVGSGELTKLILNENPAIIIGYELLLELVMIQDKRLQLVGMDYTQEDFSKFNNFCLISNPAYSTLPFIIKNVLPHIQDVILMTPPKYILLLQSLGFYVMFKLDGKDFMPEAKGEHFVVRRGLC